MASTDAAELEPGDVAFYGVRPPWVHLWERARRDGRQWFYLDNSFLDAGREVYFRVGVNALQTWSRKPSDGKRLKALGVKVQPWKGNGGHILVCPQSDEFMQTVERERSWTDRVTSEIAANTGRLIMVRGKRNAIPLQQDLTGAHMVVAHSSAAAIEALIHGVPVIVTDKACAAYEFTSEFSEIDSPRRPDGREEWAERLADSQWTISEMRDGMAWRAICDTAG